MNHTKIDFGLDLTAPSKFSGAVIGNDNKIYCIPSNSEYMVIIDPETDTATQFDYLTAEGVELSPNRYQQWSGGAVCDNGKIYCAPAYSSYILVIDTNDLSESYTMLLSFDEVEDENGNITPLNWETAHKFEGATVGPDGLVYFCPLHSPFVCVLDPSDDSYELYPSDLELNALSKFSGIINDDTSLLMVPLNYDSIVRIPFDYDTSANIEDLNPSDFTLDLFEREYRITPNRTEVVDHITINKIPYNTLRKNRWSGGVKVGDTIYTIPYVSAFSMKITDSDVEYVPVIDTDETSNKWWGGALGSDGKVYCAPYGSNSILVIDTTDDSIDLVDLNGYNGTQKWKTAVSVGDAVYFIPYMSDGFLKIDTSISEGDE